MRISGLVPLSLALCLSTWGAYAATEIEAQSSIDSVTVYPDGATVTRLVRVDVPRGDATIVARDFPLAMDPSSLRIEGEAADRLVIGAIDARRLQMLPPAKRPEIEQRIEALRDERAALDDAIAAANARKEFAERFGREVPLGVGKEGNARPIADWRIAWNAVSEEIAASNEAVRGAKLRQREIDRELTGLAKDLRTNPPEKMEVRIDLNSEAAMPATLTVRYAVRGARWIPLYDARLTTATKDTKSGIAIVRRAEIVQQTGEDWMDAAISVSTVRTAKGGNAPELKPLIVRFSAPQPAELRYAPRQSLDEMRPLAQTPKALERSAAIPAVEREAEIETGGYQAVFRIPGRVGIPSGAGAKSLRIGTMAVTPELQVRAVPVLDTTAYLEASFPHTEEAPLLPGIVALYRDAVYVGQGRMPLTPKGETVKLGFGADEKVKIARLHVRTNQGSTGIISTSKTDEREYKITVRNGHDAPIRVVIEDQVPVSEIEDVVVELLPATTAPSERNANDRRGVLAWTFTAAPGEARDLRLGWRLRWPNDRAVSYYRG